MTRGTHEQNAPTTGQDDHREAEAVLAAIARLLAREAARDVLKTAPPSTVTPTPKEHS